MTSRILYHPRETRRARRRTRRLSLRATLIGLAVVLSMTAAAIAIRLPAMQVRDIIISGLETLDESAVRATVASELAGSRFLFLPRSSYFLSDTHGLAKDLRAAFPAIADIRVEKSFPASLTLSVTERQFWGIMCNTLRRLETEFPLGNSVSKEIAPQCVAVDTTGFGYESAPLPQGNLILIVETDRAVLAPREQQIEPTLMERLRLFSIGVAEDAGLEVTRFELRERAPAEIRARVADGFLVYFRRDDDFSNTFRVLKKVLDTEIGDERDRLAYIDARFGNKVFYKFK